MSLCLGRPYSGRLSLSRRGDSHLVAPPQPDALFAVVIGLRGRLSLQNTPLDLQSLKLIDFHLLRWSAQQRLFIVLGALTSMLKTSAQLRLENLALRQQLAVLRRSAPRRLRLTPADRIFWVWLRRVWSDWKSALMIVKAETVVAWHRKGFRLFWAWRIRRGKSGRPSVPQEVRDLIRMMSRNNPRWGAPRIHGELLKLGIEITEPTVAKYMVRHRKPPSQSWRTFLDNHLRSLVSVDFFTVPTVRFQVLYVFLVLAHDRRRILHFGVTAHPTAEWTAQQLREAFPWDSAPRYLLRDRDQIFGKDFVDQVKALGIKQVLSAPRSPWQRAYVERLIGSIRRECLDHVIVFGERSLHRTLTAYCAYYHRWRTHLSLGKDAPQSRRIQPPADGAVVELREVGGLHHHYERRAA
jgi:putative transposase